MSSSCCNPTEKKSIEAGGFKFHVSLNVTDLANSIRFYQLLLGCKPVKHQVDYAKFELTEPPFVLSLIPAKTLSGSGSVNHFGLRVPHAENLVETQRRLELAGIATQREDGVECCYAKQSKFWVADPDQLLWER